MINSQSRPPLAIANFIAFVVVVAVNALATTIPLGGMTTGQLSDLYPNLFVPAGLTFAIWGVIYLLLGIFVVLRANKLVPKSLRFKKYKPFMRTSYALYMLATLLGGIVYLEVYVLGI